MPEFVTVARKSDVPAGGGATFTLGEKLIAVFEVDGAYHAIDDLCPHMGASLGSGYLEGTAVTCPWHAWRFDVTNGTWCDNPKLKVNSYEVRVEADEIQVHVPE